MASGGGGGGGGRKRQRGGGKGGGGKGGGSKGDDTRGAPPMSLSDPSMLQKMLQKHPRPRLDKTCKFWNIGECTKQGCQWTHKCWVCGENHRFIDRHR